MKDKEIIRALEVVRDTSRIPCRMLIDETLDLIERQKAEIDKLCMEIDELIISKDLLFDEAEALIKKSKIEAVKEFAENVDKMTIHTIDDEYVSWKFKFDRLVEEMVGSE